MSVKFSNNATTELASSIGTSDTSITVVDGSKFPILTAGDHTYVTLDTDTASPTREIVRVTAISGNVLTVTRGQDGTSPASFAAGTKVELRLTAALLNDVAGANPSGEPIGFPDKSQTTITFDSGIRTFSITPTGASFDVYCKGVKYTYTTVQLVTIPNTTGLHFIYFSASGVLSTQMSYFTWAEHAPTAYVYWNATTQQAVYFGDERHGITLDWQTHEYLHRTRGAAIANGFLASGYTLNSSATDAATQIAIESGTFFDEDMKIDIVSTATPTAGTYQQNLLFPAKIPVLHLQGTSWVMDAPTDFPFKQGTSRPQYNLLSGGVWSTADVGNNQHATTWILATNNLTYPVIAIIGQSATDNQGEAEAFSFADLTLTGFPSVEFRPLYKLVYKASNGYANSVNAQLVSIVDLRSISAVGAAANPATDHGNLSGLSDDDHPQYVHTSEVRTPSAAVKNSFFPSQVGQTGKYLSTDGTNTVWEPAPSGSLSFTGDVTGSGSTGSSVAMTLAASGVVAGQYTKVTVDAKGRVTAGTGVTSADVTSALGYTPYNATNPAGYTTNVGTVTSVSGTGTVSGLTLTGSVTSSGNLTLGGTLSLTSGQVTTALGFTPYNATNPSGYTNNTGTVTSVSGAGTVSGLTLTGTVTGSGSLTLGGTLSLTSGQVTTALGYTPYNSSNPSGYITSSSNITGNAATATSSSQLNGYYSSSYSGPTSAVKQFFLDNLSANGGQARTFEIARLGIDYNDWNTGIGPFEVELYEAYYSRGLKKKYVIYWGYSNVYGMQLVEYSGNGDNNFQVRIGTPVQVSGDNYYLPVFVDVRYYSYVDVRVTTNRDITASNPPGIGSAYINAAPSATNISDFTADSTVNFASTTAVQINGNQLLHAGNYSSYALPLSGGTLTGSNSPSSPILAINVSGSGAFQRGVRMLNSGMTAGDSLMYAVGNADNARNMGQFYFYFAGAGSTSNRLSMGMHSVDDVFNIFGSGNVMVGTTSDSGHKFNVSGTMNSTGALTQAGNQVLHAGNSSDYQSRSIKSARTVNVDFNSLNTANDTFVAGTNYIPYGGAYNHPADGDHHYLSWGGIGGSNIWGAQIDINFYDDRMWFRRQNGSDWQAWRNVLHDGNYNSYALPLSGGTLSGAITVTGGTNSIIAQDNGGSGDWRGRIISRNSTYDRAAFLGNYQGIAGVFAHNHALSAWADLYVNTVDGSGGGTVRMPSSVLVNGSQVLHAGNYTSYSPSLTGSGASGTWGISITGSAGSATTATRSTIEDTRAAQRTPNNYDDYRASYEFTNQIVGSDWHTAFTMQGWHDGYAAWQIIGPASTSAHENFYLRSGINTTWNSVRAILHSGNYNSYSPTLTGTGASGTWGISISGSAAQLNGRSVHQIFNNMGQVHGTYMDFNNIPDFGAYYVQGSTNGPGSGAGQFYGFTLGLGNDYAYSSYALQLAIPRYAYNSSADRYLSIRNREGGTWSAWSKISAGYADSAGNASTVASRSPGGSAGNLAYYDSSNSYLYAPTWIGIGSGSGIFSTSGTNGAHWHPTGATYGVWNMSGSKNGYSGISCSGTSHNLNWMVDMGGNLQGWYNQSYGWQMYWSSGTLSVFKNAYGGGTQATVLDSANYSSYALPLSGGSVSGNTTFTTSLTANTGITVNAASAAGYGINLYSGSSYQPIYGLFFAQTANFGTHGSVTADWATYFTMNSTTNRGWIFRLQDIGSNVASINTSGTAVFNGNVTAYSDERVKANWRRLDDGFVVKLASVMSGIYDRTDIDLTQAGVSAQSLRNVLPQTVMESSDGELSVAYGNAALVSAVELAKELVMLKRELAEIKSRLH